MQARKQQRFRNRKGFALILVFSLASIVLLLALSLVSLTQVESASSRYDQGLRVARANARLALQMALGDLQKLAGSDQRITATADGRRADQGEDFNRPSATSSSKVYQPFWTGVWDNQNETDDPVWLVTRPLAGGLQNVDPYQENLGTANELVKLVGAGTAEPQLAADQLLHDVFVPKEAIQSDSIVGFEIDETAAIGHYAYWVGDNGVKGSYLLKDLHDEVAHDLYGVDADGDPATPNLEQRRLTQLIMRRSHVEHDGRTIQASNVWLDRIRSNFALRSEEDGSSMLGNLITEPRPEGNFSNNDVRLRFHDFSGLSKGLLVDTVRGGLREDLSFIHEMDTGATADDDLVDDLVNNYLMPYLNVGALSSTSPTALTRSYIIKLGNDDFTVGDPEPTIVPVVTGVKLALRVRAPDLGSGLDPVLSSSTMKGQLEMSVKLWNPYTSAIEGNGIDTELSLHLVNLDSGAGAAGFIVVYSRLNTTSELIEVQQTNAGIGFWDLINVDEFDVIEFVIDVASEKWAPGETRMFIGIFDPPEPPASSDPLQVNLSSKSNPTIDDIPGQFYPISQLESYDSSATTFGGTPGDVNDRLHFIIPTWSPEFDLKIGGSVVGEYRLNDIAYVSALPSLHLPAKGNVGPNIAYVWELGNPNDVGLDWIGYDPRGGSLYPNVLSSLFSSDFKDPGNLLALGHVFQSSAVELLGYNDVVNPDLTHNIPLFELPRQELLSMGGLQMAEVPSGLRSHVGAWGTVGSINGIFDRFFLSTIPQSPTTWTVADPLPNGRMRVVASADLVNDLQNKDSAEHLYLNGAFNINSTSVEAWASLLKGIRLETWSFDNGAGGSENVAEEELGDSQFFRFSQSAEETWQGTYGSDADGLTRERFRKGLRSFSDADMGTFASKIVLGIRARRQASTLPMGPFVSLQDFIDSGVIQTAISEAGLNGTNTESYTSSYLTQQDVLTAIAPLLSARSDTFVIRAYGDAVNPFDDQEILARAYCEAIVQRTHAKHSTDPNSGDVMAKTGEGLGEFGRQFKIIAFRWMTGDQL